MADTPDGAVALSNDDIDDLVDDTLSEGGLGSSTDTDDEPDASGEPASETGDETDGETGDREDGEGEPPVADETPALPGAAKPGQPGEAAAGSDKPFQFKAAGGVRQFPGITERPDGTGVLTKEGAAALRQYLASTEGIQTTWKTERKQLRAEIQKAQTLRSDQDIEAEHVTKLFGDLRKMDAEQLWEWAKSFIEKAPKLELDVQKAKLERDREALKLEREGVPPDEEEQAETFRTNLVNEVRGTFTRLFQHADTKILTPEDRKELWEKWVRKAPKLVARAEADDSDNGIKKGDPVFDDEDIVDDIRDRIKVRRAAAGANKVTARNDARNADQRGARRAPPVATGRRPTQTPGVTEKPNFGKNRKAFKNAFLSGKLDTPGEE